MGPNIIQSLRPPKKINEKAETTNFSVFARGSQELFAENWLAISFLASPDALEVMLVTEWLTDLPSEWALALTWLMWPWWVMIPIEDLNDVTLAIEDTDVDDEDEED